MWKSLAAWGGCENEWSPVITAHPAPPSSSTHGVARHCDERAADGGGDGDHVVDDAFVLRVGDVGDVEDATHRVGQALQTAARLLGFAHQRHQRRPLLAERRVSYQVISIHLFCNLHSACRRLLESLPAVVGRHSAQATSLLSGNIERTTTIRCQFRVSNEPHKRVFGLWEEPRGNRRKHRNNMQTKGPRPWTEHTTVLLQQCKLLHYPGGHYNNIDNNYCS